MTELRRVPIYDPYTIRLRVRPLSPRKSLALYLWTLACLFAPLITFFWVIR